MKMKTRISRILGGKVLTAAVAGFIILSLIFIVLLSIETRGNRKALVFLISWSPLMISLVIDIINQFTDLPGSLFFNYGLAVTMAYQIVRLIGDLRLQYKEAIRYRQMQKELYEAKVSVMTSQIRPQRNSRSIYSAKNRTSLSGCPVFYLSLFVSNRLRTALVMLFLITTCHQVPQYSPPRSSFSQERVTYHSLILVFLPSFLIWLEYSLLNSVQLRLMLVLLAFLEISIQGLASVP